MLTTDDFKTRSNTLYDTCRARWRRQLERGLPKGVKLDLEPDQILPFTRREFMKWLWEQTGLQAFQCCYCRAAIDAMTMQLDHKTPLRRGGGPELSNLNPKICERCN